MSSNRPAIRVENLGKRYLIPKKRTAGSLGAHLKDFVPFLRDNTEDYFWALKDVSFVVQPGEIVGILGKNGSGKSTLLKILSNVTFPTKGRAELSGRIGSLLEVGTGFHPDLTGRENVFMAGSLMGLPQSEIRQKFDQIVDFSGIEKFIDVPVKRYSSGMYVRLAFSVASLLQSDILILDEVMAVGDAAFREKTQKNLNQIAKDGRTIIFVSHNIHAVRSLCHTGIMLADGEIVKRGAVEEIVSFYMRRLHGLAEKSQSAISDRAPQVNLDGAQGWDGERPNTILRWIETRKFDGEPTRIFHTGDSMIIRIGFTINKPVDCYYFVILFIDEFGDRVQTIYSLHDDNKIALSSSGVIECRIDDLRLISGEYSLTLDCGIIRDGKLISKDSIPNATQVQIELGSYLGAQGLQPNQGVLAQRSRWRLTANK